MPDNREGAAGWRLMVDAAKQTPRVSVITPVYNAAAYLPDLFADLKAQSFRDFDLVLSDDASSDGSLDLARALATTAPFPVTIVTHDRNAGPAAARNRALANSHGGIVAFCDADDRWSATKLERQMALFDSDPDLTIAGTQGSIVHLDGHREPIIDSWVFGLPDRRLGLFWACFLQTSSVAIRRSALPQGGFDESLLIGEDWDLFLRVAMDGKLAVIEEPMVEYRRFADTQITRQGARRWRDTMRVVERNLARYGHMLTARQRRYSRGKAHFDVGEALADPPSNRLSGIPHFLRAVLFGYRPAIALNKIANVLARQLVPGRERSE